MYYNYDACDPDEVNLAEITCYVGMNKLTQTIYADVKSDKVTIRPIDRVSLRGVVGDDNTVDNIEVRLSIDCDLPKVVRIYQITLNVPSLASQIFMDGVTMDISGKGRKNVVINHQQKINIEKSQAGRLGLLSGEMSVMDGNSKSHKVKFSLPYSCNW